MSSTTNLLDEIGNLQKFIVQAQATQVKKVEDKIQALDKATAAVREAQNDATPDKEKKLIEATNSMNLAAIDLRRAIDDQNLAYDRKLYDDLVAIRSIEKRVRNQTESSGEWQSVWYDQLKRLLKWLGAATVATILMCTLFVLALFNPNVRKVIAKTGTVSAFGVSFSFSDLQSIRASVQAREVEIEDDVKDIYIRVLRRSGLAKQFEKTMAEIHGCFRNKGVDLDGLKYRATLFIPGFVGQELVQATRYAGNSNVGDDTKIGRRFSIRFGIIGKAWRLQNCQYYPNVQNSNNNLLRDWGFTSEEAKPFQTAAAGLPAASLMAFSINDVGDAPPLGVIYIEAEGGDRLHPSGSTPAINDPDQNGRTSADRFAEHEIWDGVNSQIKEKLKRQLVRLQKLMRWNDKIQEGAGR